MGQIISSVLGIQQTGTTAVASKLNDEGSLASLTSENDISSTSVTLPSRFPTPTCKEQLIDWTNDATETVHHIHHVLQRLRFMGRNVVLSFHAYHTGHPVPSFLEFVPQDTTIQVVAVESYSCIEFNMGKLSVNEFRRVLFLLSRMKRLDQVIRDHHQQASAVASECKVCWVDPEQVLLPKCLHGICRTCHERWVGTEKSCPYCRQPFRSVKQLQQDEWEIQQWNSCELEEDMQEIEAELKMLLWRCPKLRSLSHDNNDGKDVPMIASAVTVTIEERDDDHGFSMLETRQQQDGTT